MWSWRQFLQYLKFAFLRKNQIFSNGATPQISHARYGEGQARSNGAGGGIGSAVCQLFAKEQAVVVASDINENSLLKTLESLKAQSKGKHLAVKADVTSSSSVEALADRIIEVYGQPPSIVIHAAGLQTYFAGLLNCSEEQWDFTVSVNLKGTFLINKKFIGLMREFGLTGSVVNFSSTAANGSIRAPDYSASKAGIEGFTRSVGKEMGHHGIRVNAISPGPIDTQLLHGLNNSDQLKDETPLGRLGTPDEVAQMCLFLVDDKCAFCTASVYPITGGFQR